jgi:hypothetical protein
VFPCGMAMFARVSSIEVATQIIRVLASILDLKEIPTPIHGRTRVTGEVRCCPAFGNQVRSMMQIGKTRATFVNTDEKTGRVLLVGPDRDTIQTALRKRVIPGLVRASPVWVGMFRREHLRRAALETGAFMGVALRSNLPLHVVREHVGRELYDVSRPSEEELISTLVAGCLTLE